MRLDINLVEVDVNRFLMRHFLDVLKVVVFTRDILHTAFSDCFAPQTVHE